MRDKEFYKTIFRLALPAALQSLVTLLVVMADDVMVSSLGNLSLAAVSQTNKLTTFYTAALMGLVSGSAVLISQYWGKKDEARIKRIFSIVMKLCLGISLAALLLARFAPRALLSIVIGADSADVVEVALKYLAIVSFSYVPYALSASLVGMLKSVEVVKVSLYISIVSLVTNISLNYCLIFGKFGLPAMGVEGAALATVLARLVELVIVWYYTFRVQKRLSIVPRDLLKGDKALWGDYMRYGLPVGIGDTQWALIGMLKGAIIGRLGADMMAANNICDTLMNLGMVFTSALAGGACVVVGKTVGAKQYDKTRQYSNTIQIMFAGIGVTMSMIVLLLRVPFISLYNTVDTVRALSVEMSALGALTLMGTTYHASCFVGINRGAGDSRFVMIVDMICGWLIVLPVTYLAAFVFKWPLPIVYLCTRIDQCFKWIIAFTRLKGNKWIRNVTRDDATVAS